jgi:hypothetical protein
MGGQSVNSKEDGIKNSIRLQGWPVNNMNSEQKVHNVRSRAFIPNPNRGHGPVLVGNVRQCENGGRAAQPVEMYNVGSPSSRSTSEPNCNIWCGYTLYPMYKMWSGALDWLHEYIREVPLWSSLSCHVVKSVWGDPTACRFCKGVRGSYTMHKAYKGSRCDRPAYFDQWKHWRNTVIVPY